MIEFHHPAVSDYAWVQPILNRCAMPGADCSFYNMLFWQAYYGQLAEVDGFVVQAAVFRKKLICLFPVGTGEIKPVLEKLREYAAQQGLSFCLRGVTEQLRQTLDALYPGCFRYESFRAAFDYIYTVEELAELKGRHLQSKRNSCYRFIEAHPQWRTQPLTRENADLCRELARAWYASHEQSKAAETEKQALSMALAHFDELDMDGLLLLDGERPLGFSVGGKMNEQYYDVCFEKAYADVHGAYSMINREFSRMVAQTYPQIRYLNREDDMGIEGLRRAKQSYRPALLLEKYFAYWEENR